MEKTCHTFDTTKESSAFMLGYLVGQCKRIDARPDPEEPEAILVDCHGDKAERRYYDALREYRELRVEFGCCTPEEQYAHDRELPNHGE